MAAHEYRDHSDPWIALNPDVIMSKLILVPQHMDLEPVSEIPDIPYLGRQSDLACSNGDVKAVRRLFPTERRPDVILAMAVWLSYACKFDDYIEPLSLKRALEVLSECRRVLESGDTDVCAIDSTPVNTGVIITRDLLSYLQILLPDQHGRVSVVNSIIEVLEGFEEEGKYLNERCCDSKRYLEIRNKTISVKPFFAILIIGVDAPDPLVDGDDVSLTLYALEDEIGTMIGLQNDLLGLRRDVEQRKTMNFVTLHSKDVFSDPGTEKPDFVGLERGVQAAIEQHNNASARATQLHQQVMSCSDLELRRYSCQVYAFAFYHSTLWMKSQRYQDILQ